jgi:uncharacterized protein YbaR (Trm112 family)
MKSKNVRLITSFFIGAGALSLALVRRHRRVLAESLVWQKLCHPDLEVLACPACRGTLTVASPPKEMIRMAKPGTRILICDENEKGAQAYERFLPSFKKMAGKQRPAVMPPVDLVPTEMKEVHLFDVWKGWMYCIEFRKP